MKKKPLPKPIERYAQALSNLDYQREIEGSKPNALIAAEKEGSKPNALIAAEKELKNADNSLRSWLSKNVAVRYLTVRHVVKGAPNANA